jgi:hypothetical protein
MIIILTLFIERIALVSIVYHIQFSLMEILNELLIKKDYTSALLEASLYESIYGSFKLMCSTSSTPPNQSLFNELSYSKEPSEETSCSDKLISIQQSALINVLNLTSMRFYKYYS